MQGHKAFLKFVGKAVLNALPGGFMGDLLIEVLPTVAADVWEWWAKDRSPEQRCADLLDLAAAKPEDVRAAAVEAVKEVTGNGSGEISLKLEYYLCGLPGTLRRSLRRPSDPTGGRVPTGFALGRAEDLLQILPPKLPRFWPGDRPLPGVDWELVELLGAGGFGEVWKARNPHFDGVAPVALKFCLDSSAKDRLFRHEAAVLNQVMCQGRHPGIVPLRQTYLGADPPCLEYEYVAGGELTGTIQDCRDKGGLPPLLAAQVTRKLAGILGFAHRLTPPVVHRDLKPANVLLQRRADGKTLFRIADFGIGGVAACQEVQQSQRGTPRGELLTTSLRGSCTPLYASPQQMRGDAPDPRDDVYSLGVIWHQLLTGDLGSGAPTGRRWRVQLAEKRMPEPLIDLLETCFEEKPAYRLADAGKLADEVAKLLEPVAEESPGRDRARGKQPVDAPRPDPAATPPGKSQEHGLFTVLQHLEAVAEVTERDYYTIPTIARKTGLAEAQVRAVVEYAKTYGLGESVDRLGMEVFRIYPGEQKSRRAASGASTPPALPPAAGPTIRPPVQQTLPNLFVPPEHQEAVALATSEEHLSITAIAKRAKLTADQVKRVIEEAGAAGRLDKRAKGSGFQYRVAPPETEIDEKPMQ
jgi:serine/threonine protein kinase